MFEDVLALRRASGTQLTKTAPPSSGDSRSEHSKYVKILIYGNFALLK